MHRVDFLPVAIANIGTELRKIVNWLNYWEWDVLCCSFVCIQVCKLPAFLQQQKKCFMLCESDTKELKKHKRCNLLEISIVLQYHQHWTKDWKHKSRHQTVWSNLLLSAENRGEREEKFHSFIQSWQLIVKQHGSFTKRIKSTVNFNPAVHLHCLTSEKETEHLAQVDL